MKFWYNPNFVAIFFLIFFSVFALKDLAKPGFYTNHDGETHVARIAQYYQALSDGQIPPRWAKTLSGGLGSPIFVYIYPLPYLIGSIIHFLGFSFTDSFEILIALSFVFSAIFAFLWLKEIFKSPQAAFIGALFYAWVPYRFSLIYVRASISEALAYTFIPALLWSLTKLSYKISLKQAAVTSLFTAAVLLSQNLVAYMVLPLVVIYVLIIGVIQESKLYLFAAISATFWGLLITCLTYIPVIFERDLIHFDELFKKVYNSHFVTVGQLLHSPWGYGFSLPGSNDSLSFQIGLAHILVTFLTISYLVLVYIKKNMLHLDTHINRLYITLALFFLITFFLAIFLILDNKLVVVIWRIVKPIQFIDIPWRLLGIVAIATSFIAAFVAKLANSRFVLLFLTIAVLVANRNHIRINEQKLYTDDYFLNYEGSATQYNEFTPRTRKSTGVTDDFVSPIESIKGKIKVDDFIQKSNQISFKTYNEVPARIQVNIINFKGWQVFMDGQKFVNDPTLIDKAYFFAYRPKVDSSGLFDFIVPQGTHQFLFKYQETPLRIVADTISAVSLILVVLAIAKKRHAQI